MVKKIIFFSLVLLGLCACQNDNHDNSQAEEFIHYTPTELDARSLAIRNHIVQDVPLVDETTWNREVDAFGKLSYEEYSGAHFPFSDNVKVDSIYDEDKYKTLIVSRPTDTHECNIIYIHGGAYIYNLKSIHVGYCEELINNVNANIYLPLYELAPNGHTRAAMKMLLTLYRRLLKEGKPIYIMGDSAGGNIALCFALYLKSVGEELPAALFPISPLCDFTITNPDLWELLKTDIMLSDAMMNGATSMWPDNGIASNNPLVSPIHGDLTGFPPTLIFIGNADALYPDCVLMHQKLHEANVRTGMLVGNSLWHVACLFDMPCRQQWINEVVEFMK